MALNLFNRFEEIPVERYQPFTIDINSVNENSPSIYYPASQNIDQQQRQSLQY